jgi:hypothetical protein
MTISLRFAQQTHQRAAVTDLATWLRCRRNAAIYSVIGCIFLWRAKGSSGYHRPVMAGLGVSGCRVKFLEDATPSR